MSTGGLFLIGLVMAVGLVGVIIPLIPGLLLVAGAALLWAILADGGGPWLVFAVMLGVLLAGTAAKYILPGRSLKQAGAPTSTLVLGAVGAVVGFFVIPVVGLLVGAVVGIYLGELRRLQDGGGARRSTVTTLKAIGIGLLLELFAGVVAVAIWFISVISGVG